MDDLKLNKILSIIIIILSGIIIYFYISRNKLEHFGNRKIFVPFFLYTPLAPGGCMT